MSGHFKTKRAGVLSISQVSTMDTSGEAFCEVPGCYGMALHRAVICGWPAGSICGKHANEFLKLWSELIADDVELAA